MNLNVPSRDQGAKGMGIGAEEHQTWREQFPASH
jgi:hypothetical protein